MEDSISHITEKENKYVQKMISILAFTFSAKQNRKYYYYN